MADQELNKTNHLHCSIPAAYRNAVAKVSRNRHAGAAIDASTGNRRSIPLSESPVWGCHTTRVPQYSVLTAEGGIEAPSIALELFDLGDLGDQSESKDCLIPATALPPAIASTEPRCLLLLFHQGICQHDGNSTPDLVGIEDQLVEVHEVAQEDHRDTLFRHDL